MTTYSFPTVTPNEMSIELISNTEIHRSAFTGAVKTLDRGGEHMRVTINYRNMQQANKATILALLARLNGQQHRVNLPFHAMDNRGAFGGTPLVNGASQTGNTLTVDGCSISITNWIREGDVFSVNDEMKICTADANSDGAGNITLTFWPRLRNSPANNDPIETTTPTGVFMLANNSSSMGLRPGFFADTTITFVEDIT